MSRDKRSLETIVLDAIREVMPWQDRDRAVESDALLAGDLGIESMGLVVLASRLSEQFGVELLEADQVDVTTIETVGDVVSAVRTIAGDGWR